MYTLKDSGGNIVNWTEDLKNAFKHGITRCRIGTRGYLITESGVIVQDNLGNNIIVTGGYDEDNKILSAELLDYKYVDDIGFVGQACAKKLTIELQDSKYVSNMENKEFTFELGADYNGETYYINYGRFIVEKAPENDNTNGKVKFVAYDYMVKFNKPYVVMTEQVWNHITLANSGRATLSQILDHVCSVAGVYSSSSIFANFDYKFTYEEYLQLEGLTCREALKQIATIAFACAMINQNNELRLIYINGSWARRPVPPRDYIFVKKTASDIVDTVTNNEYYSNNFKMANEYYGPINTVTFDYHDIQGQSESVVKSGTTETKELILYDSLMAYTQALRADLIQGGEVLFDLKYIPIQEMKNCGLVYLQPSDYIKVKDMENNEYYSYVLNNRIYYNGAVESTISSKAESLNEQTYYNKEASNIKNNKPEIIVDRANNQILATTKSVNNANETASTALLTANNINLKVERLENPNMLVNSNFATGDYSGWDERLTLSTKEVITIGTKKWLHIANTDTTQTLPGMRQQILGNITPNVDYTLSFLAFSTNSSTLQVEIQWVNTNRPAGQSQTIRTDTFSYSLTAIAQKYEETMTAPNEEITFIYIKFEGLTNTAFNYDLTEIKFEQSDHATGWIAAGADTVKSEILVSPEQISILANETIQMTADNIAISSTNFSVTNSGVITAKSGVIANININENGLYQSESADYNGFGLWKYGYHSSQGNYIIFHAGGNNSHVGPAMFRIYGDGRVFFKDLILEGRDSNNNPVQTLHFSNETDGSNEYWTWLKIKNGYLSIVDETNANNPFSVLTITPSIKRVMIGNVNNEFTVRLYKGINQYKEGQNLKAGLIVCGRDITNQVTTDVSGTNVEFYANGTYAGSISDKRLKKDISNLDDIENILKAIDGCKLYHFRADNRGGLIGVGIIAQDLLENCKKYGIENIFDYEIIKEIEYKEEDKNKYYVINYEQYLLMKTEVQQRKLNKQQEEINELKAQIQEIKEKLNG